MNPKHHVIWSQMYSLHCMLQAHREKLYLERETVFIKFFPWDSLLVQHFWTSWLPVWQLSLSFPRTCNLALVGLEIGTYWATVALCYASWAPLIVYFAIRKLFRNNQTHIPNIKIVEHLSLVVLDCTFTMYWPRVYSISQW